MRRSPRRWDADHQHGQREAAEIVLADPAKYPVGSGLERWAQAWVAQHPPRDTARRWERPPVAPAGPQMTLPFERGAEGAQ